ncbi:MAG: hypothetical protein IH899_20645, partial [Planctomycetes bacterium]|nr:hypothetical protein [Planctomycetota bacterium]
LLALLNAQYYIDCCPDWNLIVLVPEQLKWMVPDGVAEIWSIPWSFSNGWIWNDWLADTIHQRLSSFENCALSVAIPHPHSREWDIERFTGFKPLVPSHESILPHGPVVTFIWRDDRFWAPNAPQNRGLRVLQRISRQLNLVKNPARIQRDRFIEVAKALRQDYPEINLAVAGLGERHSGLPVWIRDERTLQVSESIERSWCERYARSHLVIGMHGSNMLLPSAHAGAVLELVATDRWGNFYQDILLHETDSRTLAHRCRFLPDETSPKTVAEVARTMLTLPKWLKLCEARRRVTAAGSFHRPHQSGLKEQQCAALPE